MKKRTSKKASGKKTSSRKVPFVDLGLQAEEAKVPLLKKWSAVLASGIFLYGQHLKRFEKQFAKFCTTKYAVGLGSGTDALQLSLIACGVSKKDEVITPSNTFASSAISILRLGAVPVFVDINPTTYNIDPEKIEEKITNKTKVIMPVHLYGHPADMKKVLPLAKTHNLKVIEDACQAHGARFNDKSVGSFGDIAAFSFYPTKNLASFSDAGAVVTNRKSYANHVRKLGSYGFGKRYVSEELGFNSRLDELQAVWLSLHLKRLNRRNRKRRALAKRYLKRLAHLPLILPEEEKGAYQVYHQFIIRTPVREALKKFLQKKGITTIIHYPIPIHRQPAFRHLPRVSLPVTEKVSREILSLPIYPQMTAEQLNYVCKSIHEFYQRAP